MRCRFYGAKHAAELAVPGPCWSLELQQGRDRELLTVIVGRVRLESDKPQGRGQQENCFSSPRLLHKPHSALCFQEANVLERKDKSICKLLFLGPLGSRVCWIRTWALSKPAFEMGFYTISGCYGFNIMLGRNQSFC